MQTIQKRIASIVESPNANTDQKLEKICYLLDQEFAHFNWTGFYFRNGDLEELLLGSYCGEVTDHTTIPFGKGICGQVAVSGETFVVEDVSQQNNYLSCSVATKSEIVVPIFKNGKNVGQIDIDSHQINAFSKADRELLEWLAEEVAKFL